MVCMSAKPLQNILKIEITVTLDLLDPQRAETPKKATHEAVGLPRLTLAY